MIDWYMVALFIGLLVAGWFLQVFLFGLAMGAFVGAVTANMPPDAAQQRSEEK